MHFYSMPQSLVAILSTMKDKPEHFGGEYGCQVGKEEEGGRNEGRLIGLLLAVL